ncbi:cytochrome c3 family protein [Candidatus Saganbacteria bacterium]|nr:cytochrome c3 family protein [Candidatus Saganbacteria bacterium]
MKLFSPLLLVPIFLMMPYWAERSFAEPAAFIGQDKCFDCHDEKKDLWLKNPHNNKTNKSACEACHGPGGAHQETMDKTKIINPANLDSDAVIKLCGACHFSKGGKLDQSVWGKSIHAQSGFSCLNCHDPHKAENPKLLVKSAPKEVCYQCHDDRKKVYEKRAHGKNNVQCSDCHAPHGSIYDKLLKKDSEGEHFCQACHKLEPHHFLSAKATIKMLKLGCTNCHMHNSNEEYYLKFKKEDLCIQCHKDYY